MPKELVRKFFQLIYDSSQNAYIYFYHNTLCYSTLRPSVNHYSCWLTICLYHTWYKLCTHFDWLTRWTLTQAAIVIDVINNLMTSHHRVPDVTGTLYLHTRNYTWPRFPLIQADIIVVETGHTTRNCWIWNLFHTRKLFFKSCKKHSLKLVSFVTFKK